MKLRLSEKYKMHILSRNSALPVVKRQSNACLFQIPTLDDDNGISVDYLYINIIKDAGLRSMRVKYNEENSS